MSYVARVGREFSSPLPHERPGTTIAVSKVSNVLTSPQKQSIPFSPIRGVFEFQTKAFLKASLLVRCFYACDLFFALELLPQWQALLNRSNPAPLWPVMWLNHVSFREGIAAILVLYLAGAFVGAIFPEKRWARLLSFLGVFEWVAFNNSFGNIGHNMHLWVLVSALLVFLPTMRREPSRSTRQKFLLIFWGCQAMIMLTYSMAGLGKVLGAIYQLCSGENNAFMPGAMASVVAERLLETNSQSVLGPWLIRHPLAGWPFMWAGIYLEFFALWTVFRPSLQRLWGIGLIMFHIGSFLLLTISFPQNALLLALFFANSPFRRESQDWRQALSDLPMFGRLFPQRCVS